MVAILSDPAAAISSAINLSQGLPVRSGLESQVADLLIKRDLEYALNLFGAPLKGNEEEDQLAAFA
ncbi:hypothetical protein BGX38DRAFT_1272990 [Terfezia claveryi]|nr:hypothetical protein BGX38DRAFT_1272990 [Terfezia claveryi]